MVNHVYTEDEVIEYMQCVDDPLPFMLRCHITTTGGWQVFEPYLYQLDLIDRFHSEKRLIVNSARQMGCTNILAMYALWAATTKPNHTVAIFGDRHAGAVEAMSRVHVALDHLPPHLKPNTVRSLKASLTFDNGSAIHSASISSHAMRGMGLNTILIDSAAYCAHQAGRDFWQGIYPTIACAADSKIIIQSTPSEPEGVYHDIWSNAPHNGFARHTIPWYQHPERNPAWAKTMLDQMGRERFCTEFLNMFRGQSEFLI